MRQDIASDVIALYEQGRIPADKIDDVRKNALNGLNESAGIYETAAERFWGVSQQAKPDEWLLGRRARLSSAILRLYKAELMATDPKKKGGVIWEGELDEAKTTLEDFIWEHEDVLILSLIHI